MKKISIIGSTGSIGQSTLQIVRHLKERFEIVGLAAGSNNVLLEEQIREFKPKIAALHDAAKARELRQKFPHMEILDGIEGVTAVASHSDAQFVVSAMTGTLGLIPTIAAIEAGIDVGLANKEALVSGGALVMNAVKRKGVQLLPIDSEHSAIFQCLNGENPKTARRIILTSSGGPFRTYPKEKLASVTVDEALRHPTWNMGPKVTIDSSTLMNKGLEVIEAHWLFSMPLNKIDVVIHPQSIIHSMVEFDDGSIMAQMGEPKMITPIQYALTYPDRCPGLLEPFDFVKNGTLQFFAPDRQSFKCLGLAYEAAKIGDSMPCYMNAANEVLVSRCLRREIPWFDIGHKLEALMERHQTISISSLDVVYAMDSQARKEASLV